MEKMVRWRGANPSHYPNDQRATTLWYHDHALGITRLNVYAGLAGFYLIRDDEEDALKPACLAVRYEIPLLIQDPQIQSGWIFALSRGAEWNSSCLDPGIFR